MCTVVAMSQDYPECYKFEALCMNCGLADSSVLPVVCDLNSKITKHPYHWLTLTFPSKSSGSALRLFIVSIRSLRSG